MFTRLLLIGFGGSIGAVSRYLISFWALKTFGNYLPFGTLLVNAIASLIAGFVVMYSTTIASIDPKITNFLVIGMMGGLSTFSTFSVETFVLLKSSSYLLAGLNTLLNLVICLASVWIGAIIAKFMA